MAETCGFQAMFPKSGPFAILRFLRPIVVLKGGDSSTKLILSCWGMEPFLKAAGLNLHIGHGSPSIVNDKDAL